MAYFDTLNTCQNGNFLPIWIGVQLRFKLSHWLVNHSGFGVSPYSAVTTMSAWCQPGNLTKFSRQKLVLFGIFCFWAISTDKVEMKNMRIGIIIRGKNFKGELSFVPARNRAAETSSWNLKVFSRNQFAPILRHNDFDLPTMAGRGWRACTWKLLTTSLPENLPACRKLCSIAQLGITFARFQQLAALLHYKSFQHLNVGKLHFQATGCAAG